MQYRVICVLGLTLMLALSTLAQAPAETCVVDPHERKNCGPPGVTREACEQQGCCFDDLVTRVPWCYYPVAEECDF
ncbi:trefoil factor 1 [Echinops telfairi]|uniref:Trefoil factor 1 n=1 Tax=Echinops telfairi TaxID=9371 RepID=A0AC55CJL6_ECHTE|nr:trefoil factor 1 [Echinops telfairi]